MILKSIGSATSSVLLALMVGLFSSLLCSSNSYALDKKLQAAFDELKTSKLDPMQAGAKFEKSIDTNVDVAEAALILEKQVDAKVDVKKYLKQLDEMVGEVKVLTGNRTDPKQKLHMLRHYLFSVFGMKYDFSDPFAEKRSNFTLSGILSTKRGSCVTMPLLFLVMSQKLGYPVHAILLPQHMFLRYSAIPAAVYDMEVTSDGDIFKELDHYAKDKSYGLSEEGVKSGSYMKELSYKETISVLLSYSAQHFFFKKLDFDKGFRYINAAISLRENSANLYVAKSQFFGHVSHLAAKDNAIQWPNTYMHYSNLYAQKARTLGFTNRPESWKKEYSQMMSGLKEQEKSNDSKKVL